MDRRGMEREGMEGSLIILSETEGKWNEGREEFQHSRRTVTKFNQLRKQERKGKNRRCG